MRVFLPLLAMMAMLAVPAKAQDHDQRWCSDTWSSGKFDISTIQDITLMRAIEAPRTYLLQRNGYKPGCPQKGAACRTAYILPGQEVLVVGSTAGDYLCAVFPNKRGGTEGWVSQKALQASPAQPTHAASLQAWEGNWTIDADTTIRIMTVGKMLSGKGKTLWVGRGEGNVNDGEFEAQAVPQGERVLFSEGEGEYDCRVSAKLFGDYLLVSDNLHCGGLNTSFGGVYRREKKR